MRKVICFVLMFVFVPIQNSFASELNWKAPKAKLRSVYAPVKKSQNIELIRLYNDNTFEHLVYTPSPEKGDQTKYNKEHRSTVLRNVGTYSLASGKLELKCTSNEFGSALYDQSYFIDGNVYENRMAAKFKKKQYILRKVNRNKNDFPFYLDPVSHTIVYNEDAPIKVELKELTQFIIRDAHNDKTKLEAIRSFIRKAIEYDTKGAESYNFTNDQNDIATLLAGQNRVAVCSGYSLTMKELCELAGLETRYVTGHAKLGAGNSGYFGEPHAWNIIKVGAQYQIHDITWGKKWWNVNPAIMIHSHFPDNEEDQLLEDPVELSEFSIMAYAEPNGHNARYVSFIPARGELHGNNKLELLFEETVSISSVDYTDLNPDNTASYKDRLNGVKSISTGGGTRLIIPLKYKVGHLSIRLSSGMVLKFIVRNDGREETDIAEFYKNNHRQHYLRVANRERMNSRNTAKPENKNGNRIEGTNKYANDAFLNELYLCDYSNFSALDHPLILQARKFYGLTEIPGRKHNSKILKFFKETGNGSVKTDENAWCSVFIGYCAKQTGLEYSKKTLAQSWLKKGKAVKNPQPGDLVIFWRDNARSWKGHVGIFLGIDKATNEVICLGGNQSDMVCISQYPVHRVLGYRRLSKR